MSIPCLIERNDDGTETHLFRPRTTQESFEQLTEECTNKGLKINVKKTQLLTISSSRNTNSAWLKLNDGSALHSSDTLKLLGFMFNSNPNVHSQFKHIIDCAASRTIVLRRLAGVNPDKLKNVYCSVIRSVLEYSNVTFGPMLTKYEKNQLERMQKKGLRSIYGPNKTYEQLLELSGLERLEARREKALMKFALKTTKNPQFEHLFPLNKNRTIQRNA